MFRDAGRVSILIQMEKQKLFMNSQGVWKCSQQKARGVFFMTVKLDWNGWIKLVHISGRVMTSHVELQGKCQKISLWFEAEDIVKMALFDFIQEKKFSHFISFFISNFVIFPKKIFFFIFQVVNWLFFSYWKKIKTILRKTEKFPQ